MKRAGVTVLVLSLLSTGVGPLYPTAASAQQPDGTVKDQVNDLNSAVTDKQSRIKDLDALIAGYRQRISDQDTQQTSLENETVLLDNQIKEKELSIQRDKTEIEMLNIEIQDLETFIATQEQRISTQKDLIADFLRRVNQADEVTTMDVFLTKPSLSSFFDRIEELKGLERDLGDSIDKLKDVKDSLEQTKKTRDDRRTQVAADQKTLSKEELALEAERNFKISLIDETKQSQQEFERILYELQQQQQSTAADISSLESKLKTTLDSVDDALARGDVLLNWPVDPAKGITAKFHDPNYPFRNLFQHPGVDIRATVGTPVKAAAGGYVAWNKTGSMYGNYVMVVHPGGIATVYAHLSKFIAKPDTYIERGDIIGLSGGMPGMQGAGLSTGPHVHFEVRQGGIPVDPMNFLPTIAED